MKKLLFIFSLCIGLSVHSQIDYESFQGGKSKITFNKKYTFANIYDYRINAVGGDSLVARKLSQTIPEGALTQKYRSEISLNQPDSVAFEISMHSKYSVGINDVRHCFIKYRLKENETTSEQKMVHVVENAGNWTESPINTPELQDLQNVFTFADVEMLFQFFNDRNDSDYPEINNLKPSTKTADGSLDIVKLLAVFNENRDALSAYLRD